MRCAFAKRKVLFKGESRRIETGIIINLIHNSETHTLAYRVYFALFHKSQMPQIPPMHPVIPPISLFISMEICSFCPSSPLNP